MNLYYVPWILPALRLRDLQDAWSCPDSCTGASLSIACKLVSSCFLSLRWFPFSPYIKAIQCGWLPPNCMRCWIRSIAFERTASLTVSPCESLSLLGVTLSVIELRDWRSLWTPSTSALPEPRKAKARAKATTKAIAKAARERTFVEC